MESVEKSTENFDLANIPKELYLFDDGVMADWIGDEIPAAKKRKAMSYVTSRFGNKLASDFELTLIIRVRSQTKVKFCQYHIPLH